MARLDERNEHVWRSHARSLMELHRGRWAAITAEGEFLLGDADLEVSKAGDLRFGKHNYYAVRLDERRGAHRLRPRSG